MALKHVGRIKANKRKVIVAYRTIPGDSNSALIVDTASLDPADHDSIMTLLESNAGQTAYEFAEAMSRYKLPDGSTMLPKLHRAGKLQKFATSDILMTPDTNSSVSLDELNKIIAEQKGVTVDELAIKEDTKVETIATAQEVPTTNVAAEAQTANIQAPQDGVLSDEDLAASYRSQADRMYKEAKRLRDEAEKLVPTKKKSGAKVEAS